MIYERITLEGTLARLEPIALHHLDGLCQAIKDGELWKLFFTRIPHIDEVDDFFQDAMNVQEAGDGLVFVTTDKATGRVAGSTRFFRTSWENKRVEIGFTFIGKTYQRSGINTEAKLLMLKYAFDTLDMNRVEFLTDYLNLRSRNAILRLGAKQEGVLRNHILMPDGRVRDSVIFSIIKSEWPGVKQNLEFKLDSYNF